MGILIFLLLLLIEICWISILVPWLTGCKSLCVDLLWVSTSLYSNRCLLASCILHPSGKKSIKAAVVKDLPIRYTCSEELWRWEAS